MFSLLMVSFLSFLLIQDSRPHFRRFVPPGGSAAAPPALRRHKKMPPHSSVQGTRISRGSTLLLSPKAFLPRRKRLISTDNGAAGPVRRPLGGGTVRLSGRALAPFAPLSAPVPTKACPLHRCAVIIGRKPPKVNPFIFLPFRPRPSLPARHPAVPINIAVYNVVQCIAMLNNVEFLATSAGSL